MFGGIRDVRKHINVGFGDDPLVFHTAYGKRKAKADDKVQHRRRDILFVSVILTHRNKERHEHRREERKQQE